MSKLSISTKEAKHFSSNYFSEIGLGGVWGVGGSRKIKNKTNFNFKLYVFRLFKMGPTFTRGFPFPFKECSPMKNDLVFHCKGNG